MTSTVKRWSRSSSPESADARRPELDDLRRVASVGGRLCCLGERLDRLRGSDGSDLGGAGGEDRRGLRRDSAAQLDRAPEMHQVGADAKVEDKTAGAVEQRERLLGTSGQPGVLRGSHQPAPAGRVVARQLGRALERARRPRSRSCAALAAPFARARGLPRRRARARPRPGARRGDPRPARRRTRSRAPGGRPAAARSWHRRRASSGRVGGGTRRCRQRRAPGPRPRPPRARPARCPTPRPP